MPPVPDVASLACSVTEVQDPKSWRGIFRPISSSITAVLLPWPRLLFEKRRKIGNTLGIRENVIPFTGRIECWLDRTEAMVSSVAQCQCPPAHIVTQVGKAHSYLLHLSPAPFPGLLKGTCSPPDLPV